VGRSQPGKCARGQRKDSPLKIGVGRTRNEKRLLVRKLEEIGTLGSLTHTVTRKKHVKPFGSPSGGCGAGPPPCPLGLRGNSQGRAGVWKSTPLAQKNKCCPQTLRKGHPCPRGKKVRKKQNKPPHPRGDKGNTKESTASNGIKVGWLI